VEDGNVLDCSIDVTDSDGVNISFTIPENETNVAVSFTTFTSLTCDAHSNEASAADPYLYLLDDSDNEIASDDDSASHNDGTNFCWDSYISTSLDSGTYTLNLNVYENFYGVYSMDIAGLTEVTTPTTTTTTTTTTSTTTTSTTTTTTSTTSTTTTTTTTTTEPPPETTTTTTTTTTTEPPPPPTSTTTTTTTTTTTEPPLIIFEFDELEELPEQEFDLDEWLQEQESTEQATEVEPDNNEPEPEPEQEVEFETETETVDLVDLLTEEELDKLEIDEVELLEELLNDPDIDVELVQELEEVLDEEITIEEIEALTDNEDFDELPVEARAEIVEAVNKAPEEVKEQFEENVDVFESGYGDYVQTGSTIPVDERKTIIVVSTVTAIGATIRPTTTTTPTAGPTSGPTRRRGRNV
jgi:hypothetical protein